MPTSHLKALQAKHEKLEEKIREESLRAARNESLIDELKKKKLHLRDEIEREKKSAGG